MANILRITVVQYVYNAAVSNNTIRVVVANTVATITQPLPNGDYGDITASGTPPGSVLTIDANAVTNAKLADMVQTTIKGRQTGTTGDPEDLTAAQARAVMSVPSTAEMDAAILVAVQALDWKDNVRVATTVAGVLATDFENGDTIDAIVLATGDRILIKNQAAGADNGIYTVNATGAPTRGLDANSAAEVQDAVVKVEEGTVNTSKIFKQTAANVTLGTTALVFQEVGGAAVIPGGTDTQVQFNDAGVFGGDAGFVYNKTTNVGTIGQMVVGDGTAANPGLRGTTGQSGMFFDGSARTNIAALGLAHSVFDVGTGYRFGTGGKSSALAVLHIGAGLANANYGQLLFDASPGLTTPVPGCMEYITNKWYFAKNTALPESIPGVVFVQTADKTVTNTVVETSIIGTGSTPRADAVAIPALPANFFAISKTIRIRIGGVYSTPVGTSSLIIKVKLGATVIATVTTSALAALASNLEFDGELLITCRVVGATATVVVHGDIEYVTGVGIIAVDSLNNAGATTTIDSTAALTPDITVQWDAATTTRSVKSTVLIEEILN